MGADSLVNHPFTNTMKNTEMAIVAQYDGLRNSPVLSRRVSSRTTPTTATTAATVYSGISGRAPGGRPRR